MVSVLTFLPKFLFIFLLVIHLVELYSGDKDGKEKRAEAVSLIKNALDTNVFKLPSVFGKIEEGVIGIAIDVTIYYFNFISNSFFASQKETSPTPAETVPAEVAPAPEVIEKAAEVVSVVKNAAENIENIFKIIP